MTEELLSEFKDKIAALTLVPATSGRYEVSIDDELVFSKLQVGRFPDTNEIREKILAKA